MIRLDEINEDNWRLPLEVAENQKTFVAPPASILARAYAYRHSRSMAYVIYADDTPVGMAMYHDCDPLDAFDFSQFFIDARYQRKGYGRTAVRAILELMKADGKYQKVVLCYIEGNDAARRLYESFGFRETDRDGNEIIMELTF
ncbi:MAG: GNAT family N-acetyltransferase [Oscillospiraceae bacterium]|nr:GNAT family N-acetyltransferase [Oscillospiraceae bacterium]